MNEDLTIRIKARWVRIAVLVAVVALVAFPAGVMAGHRFADVSDTNIFHGDISWLADADVTRGCNPPDNTEFCPKDNVTREQMAAFMNRLANNQVVDAGWLEGKDSSEFLTSGTLVTATAGSGWLTHSTAPTSVDRFISGTRFSGDGNVVLALAAPTEVGGTAYGLATFQLCYILSSGGFIDRVEAFRTDDGSTSATQIFADNTDRTTSGCTTFNVDRAVGNGAGIFVGLAGGGTVRLEGVKATWSTAANVTSAGTSGETGPENSS